jgi:hypothetical protein
MLLGASLGRPPVEDAVLVAVALAVSTTALLFLGVAAMRAGRRRRRSKGAEERRELVASLDSAKKLLEWKVELLLAQVKDLEGRKAALTGALQPGVMADHGEPLPDARLVVIPDLLPEADAVGSPAKDTPAVAEDS